MNKQDLIAKYGKKFASVSHTTPILQGVHYAKDGSIYATNRYYALHIKDAHQLSHTLTVHAKNGVPIPGDYPDVTKVFTNHRTQREILISGKDLPSVLLIASCALLAAKKLDKNFQKVSLMTVVNGMTYLQLRNEELQLEFSAHIGNTDKLEESKISLNAEYLHAALSLFYDADSSLIRVKIGSVFESMVIEDEEQGISVLLLPYRTA